MPQMMPINWIISFILFIFIFFLFNIMNFYIFNKKKEIIIKKNFFKKLSLNWKW